MSPASPDSDETLRGQWQLRPAKNRPAEEPPPKPRRFSLEPLFKWGRLHLRAFDDDGEEDWWFASTAIPLLAATVGPLANVLSIAALVVSWRANRLPGGDDACLQFNGNTTTLLPELQSNSYADPLWCYRLNIVSLVFGFVGNLFLLANFTNRIRYIVALPVTILLWFLATAILIGITIGMHIYASPVGPCQTYTQGFWYAVIAAVLYFTCSMLLMINMLGYFLGHYPQRFTLTEAQRTLILQTMMFFLWLAGGAGIFSRIEQDIGGQGWLFTDALYFCDVTILTVGFGDLTPADDVGRGIVFPYSVGGIIMLGLMVSSLATFVGDLSSENVVKKHLNNRRQRTLERSTSLQQELFDAQAKHFKQPPVISSPKFGRRLSAPTDLQMPISKEDYIHKETGSIPQVQKDADSRPTLALETSKASSPTTDLSHSETPTTADSPNQSAPPSPILRRLTHRSTIKIASAPKPPHINTHRRQKARHKALRLQLLHKEKDRFDAMRRIQRNAASFKNYTALAISVLAFCILWLAGAAVFHVAEADTLGLTYFQSLYFCYVSLLTIGYGDFAPKSSAGRPFFVVWSLLAVPTMTILVSHLGATIIASFTKGTSLVADFTVLPKYGVWRSFLDRHPWLLGKLQTRAERKEREKRLEEGFRTGPDPSAPEAQIDDGGVSAVTAPATLNDLVAAEADESAERLTPLQREGRLAKRLAAAIRRTASDLAAGGEKRYTYEEWVEFTTLIRFTSRRRMRERGYPLTPLEEADEEGLVEWDWIGADSPMMAGKSEPGFVMERLCESLGRFVAAQEVRNGRPLHAHPHHHAHAHRGEGLPVEEASEPNTPVHLHARRRWPAADSAEEVIEEKKEE